MVTPEEYGVCEAWGTRGYVCVSAGAGSRREEIEASETGGCFQEERKREKACPSEKDLANTSNVRGFV